MKLLLSPQVRTHPVIAFILLSAATLLGQTAAVPARVTQPVDLENVVTLQGNTHPLARPEFDQGAAPDSLPMQRILLVLQRSVEQERTLRELLDKQQIKSSPNYHMWLVPEQFGQQFGPAEADIQAVTDWLASQGFEVNRVAAGRTVIEFSGTAGAVRQALHTEIHKYVVNGEEHWANASDPQIPAALQPVVAGFASLNNFPRHPTMKRVGAFSRSKATGVVKPLFTQPSNNGANYFLGPTDFATIYNILPLWKASSPIDGTGQTIAIVAETNINVQDVADFRNLFGLPPNAPQVILNGPDPGVTFDETESDLDTQWSGAVAKNATIDLVVSESTETSQGVDLSTLYIIDNNLAPVMSESYSCCEAFLGTGGNAFASALYEQGAAQGITIILSAGDTGSAGCDDGVAAAQNGLAVSGLASTPFNVAVGGTDFNDVNSWSTYWSSTNNATTLASALSYIPEIPWNDSCARNGNAGDCASAGSDPHGVDLTGGGGGASSCVTSNYNGESTTCTSGYPKPAWQSGPGVPNDGVRDIPDVSLFASNGFNGTSYVVCEADTVQPESISCNPADPNWVFLGVGGTSASAPAFAGMMALVNQKTGQRQGNANYVLYALAAQSGSSCASNAAMAPTANSSGCIFYDVSTGNNSVACMGGSPNCSNTTSGGYGLLEVNPPTDPSLGWMAAAGYDLATGLGSVNAANLVNNWTSVSFKPTTTTLSNLSPTTTAHGQPVSFSVSVAPGTGSGTPTGDVSVNAQTGSSSSGVTVIGSFPLSGGSVSSSTNLLPGGTYSVTAHYAGDGNYGASDSAPVQVSITPEGSQTHIALLTFDPITGNETSSNATSVVYGASLNILRVDVTNDSGQVCASSVPYGCPSGQVTLTDNGQPLDLGGYTLNNLGYAEDQAVQFTFGANKVAASYSGDSSFNTSSSATDTITYNQAPTTVTLSGLPSTATLSAPISFTATVNTQSYGVAPTSTVQVLDGGTPVQATVGSITSTNGSNSGTASLQIPLSIKVSAGVNSITAQYAGDSNYLTSTSAAGTVTVGDYSLSVNPSTLNISAPGQSGSTTISITPQNGFTGAVSLSCANSSPGMACTISPASVNITGSSPLTATLTATTTAPVNSSMLSAPGPGADASPLAPKWVAHALTPSDVPRPHAASWGDGIKSYLWAACEVIRQQAEPRRYIFLAVFLPLMLLMGVAKARRPACLLLATALLVVGIWAACSGPHSEESSSAPAINLSSASVAFGQQNVGSTSAPQVVTLANTGNASLSIASMAVSGTNSGDFAQTSNCGGSVAAGSNCTITVTFTPSAAGSRSASLTVSDNAGGSPQTIGLTGTGLQPVVSLSPGSLTFTQQSTGSTSTAQSVTLSDTGNTSLSISSIGLSGANAADFAQTNDCGSGVGVGGSCTIMVTFAPAAAGSRSASLLVTDNASGSPQTVSVNGTGVTPATTLSLSASSLAFGQENMAASTLPQTVTLSNTGKATLSISSITVAGANPGDFAQTNTCGASVAAGTNCSLSVTFAPAAMGSRTASLSISDNASGSPQTVSLTGTGIPQATPPGNYVIGYSAQSGNDAHSGQLNVTVQ
jgi:subtilase family serine protease